MFFRLQGFITRKLAEEQSLISELWDYFTQKYFSPDLSGYDNFSLGGTSMFSVRTVIFGIYIGLNLAAILAIFDKRVLGDFVRALLGEDCLSKESAKTVAELGFAKNTAVRSSLKSGYTLRRVVKCVEEEQFYADLAEKQAEYEKEAALAAERGEKMPKFRATEFKVDLATAHFYIPEQIKYTAEQKFEKKGTNWLTFAGVFLLSTAALFAVFALLPDLLRMLDNTINMVSGR